MPRPNGSAELLEAHRRQALRLLEEAYSVNEVGRLVLAASSVMRWRDALQTGGEGALKVRCSRPPPACVPLSASAWQSCCSRRPWPTVSVPSCGQRGAWRCSSANISACVSIAVTWPTCCTNWALSLQEASTPSPRARCHAGRGLETQPLTADKKNAARLATNAA